MAYYDEMLRRKRNSSNPLKPLPNYVPAYGSGASVGELDAGIAKQGEFNRGLVAPGGLTPYYGTGYTQQAQSSRPMTPAFSGGVVRAPSPSPKRFAGGLPVLGGGSPSLGPELSADEFAISGRGPMVAGTGGVAQPAQNAIQRWQSRFGNTALDQRPTPQPDFTPGQLRRISTGRYGGPVRSSPNERMGGGGTSVEDWRKIFGANTSL